MTTTVGALVPTCSTMSAVPFGLERLGDLSRSMSSGLAISVSEPLIALGDGDRPRVDILPSLLAVLVANVLCPVNSVPVPISTKPFLAFYLFLQLQLLLKNASTMGSSDTIWLATITVGLYFSSIYFFFVARFGHCDVWDYRYGVQSRAQSSQ